MESFGKAHVPYGDDGAGNYSLMHKSPFLIMDNAVDDVMTSINSVPFSPGNNTSSAFVICDFGSADGGTSLKLIDSIIQEIRRLYPDQEILIQYEDQPNNDFKSLFYHVQGMNKITDAANKEVVPYTMEHENVFVTCSGTSFYAQCFPSNTVHLSMSITAMHWLSKLPCRLPNNIHSSLLPRGSDEFIAFQSQAEKDWNLILVNRGKELCVGGRFVVVNICADENGNYDGTIPGKKNENGFKVFDEIWNGMREEGVISQNEFEEATFMDFFRTEEDVRRPFVDPCSEVRKLGLRIVSLRREVRECPQLNFSKTSKSTISSEEFARFYVEEVRPWSNSIFFSALSDSRTLQERERVVDQFYSRYYNRIAKEPDSFSLRYIHHHYIVIEKEAINA